MNLFLFFFKVKGFLFQLTDRLRSFAHQENDRHIEYLKYYTSILDNGVAQGIEDPNGHLFYKNSFVKDTAGLKGWLWKLDYQQHGWKHTSSLAACRVSSVISACRLNLDCCCCCILNNKCEWVWERGSAGQRRQKRLLQSLLMLPCLKGRGGKFLHSGRIEFGLNSW